MAKVLKSSNSTSIYRKTASSLQIALGKKVLCAFSGGVDSLVAATLTSQVLGKRNVYCLFVDHGLIRPQDLHHIKTLQRKTNLNIRIIDASEVFLRKLKGIKDPEKKRKIIGKTFIEVFEQETKKLAKKEKTKFEYLLQGTIYPDIVESKSSHPKDGRSVTIKSHHNVGGLPKRMKLKLLEPLSSLFKDEVRKLGGFLKLKKEWLNRHPFPGPGLGVRIVGQITKENLRILKMADEILLEEMNRSNLYHQIWQAFLVYLPVKTVGVKDNRRAYEHVLSLRLINSTDAMTATCFKAPYSFLEKISSRITSEIPGITRVLYDITNKPPATIEWE